MLTEADPGDPATADPRALTENIVVSLAERRVRSSAVRLAPTVHGTGDAGFVPTLIGLTRERGVSAQLGFLGAVVALDMPASSTATRELLRWKPTGPQLVDDLTQDHYVATVLV